MDVYSFPYEIDTFIPVSAENLYAKGEKVSYAHISDKALVGEVFRILNNMAFKNYYHELRETRFLIKLKTVGKTWKSPFRMKPTRRILWFPD